MVEKSPLEARMADLLPRCLDTNDELRPTSAFIIEELEPHLASREEEFNGMMSIVVSRILDCDTKTQTQAHKKELRDDIRLCSRLLETGLRPTISSLSAAVAFLLRCQLVRVGPAWKVSKVEEMVVLLESLKPPEISEYETLLKTEGAFEALYTLTKSLNDRRMQARRMESMNEDGGLYDETKLDDMNRMIEALEDRKKEKKR